MRRRLAPVLLALTLAASACAGLPASAPTCDALEVLALQAQSVPSAQRLVCLAEVPDGWTVATYDVDDGGTTLVLDHAVAGRRALVALISEDCRRQDGTAGPDEFVEEIVREVVRQDETVHAEERFVDLQGACASVHLHLATEDASQLLEEVDRMVTPIRRDDLRDTLSDRSGGRLELP